MNKKIKTYNDLLNEKQQLEMLLHAQKELIVADIKELKHDLQPAVDAISFLGQITTRDNRELLVTGAANSLIDIVFKKIILSKTGWLSRLVVPFFVKNYSSHYIAEHKDEWLRKLFSWVSSKNSNGEVNAKKSS